MQMQMQMQMAQTPRCRLPLLAYLQFVLVAQRGFYAEAVFTVINYLFTLLCSQLFNGLIVSVVGE